jgi:alkyl hydroperoxide reductase subunit AhpF
MEQRVGLRRDGDAHSVDIRSIRESIADLVKQVSIASSKVDKTDMRMSAFTDSVNTRFESVDARFGAVPTKLQVALWGLRA